ncbi:hypothetical protein EG829_25340 [bacterium]|nr:hypothetical protein [bacterium]
MTVMDMPQTRNALRKRPSPYSLLHECHRRMRKHASGNSDRKAIPSTGGAMWCRALFSTVNPMSHMKNTGRFFQMNFMVGSGYHLKNTCSTECSHFT